MPHTTTINRADVKDLGIQAISFENGPDEETITLTGGVTIKTDDAIALAAFFVGLGKMITTSYVDRYGSEAALRRLDAVLAPDPFDAEPAPEQLDLGIPVVEDTVPDVEGRDV